MEFFLGAFMIFPLLGVCFLLSSATLYFTLKLFTVAQNQFGTALKVTFLAMLLSFLASMVFGLLGIVIPLVPYLLGLVAPLGIYLYLLQKNYNLSLASALLVSLIQVLISLAMGAVVFFVVLLPLGLGAAIFGG